LRLKESIRGFAEGYDAANPDKFSALAFRDEWMDSDEGSQYRIDGGYSALIEWMAKQVQKNGGKIFQNVVVKEIHWSKGDVEVIASSGEKFMAEKIIITIPLGVLIANEIEQGAVSFSPSVPERIDAAKLMGYGEVIKILLEFNESFWSPEKIKERLRLDLPPLSFIMSKQRIPTWWTQYPQDANWLTGWLAGPRAEKMKTLSDEMLLEDSLQSLAAIFRMNIDELKSKLIASKIFNWSNDPFARGAYAYTTVRSSDAKKLLNTPVDETLYFAGEALDDGPSMGTVEAAFANGISVAKKIVGQ
jgi:monoamine oxidase